jgi:fucose permease
MVKEKVSTWIVFTAFLGTGLGTALPGAMLPLLLNRWSMTDREAGSLFFLFFVGSASGALLSRGSLSASIVRGCVILATGAVALVLAHRPFELLAVPIYGLGLGIVMTSISVLQARRHANARTAEMARLNFLWVLGACLGPSIGLRGAAAFGTAAVFYGIAGFFVVIAVAARIFVQHAAPANETGTLADRARIPIALVVLVPLSTGVESAAGGWLATYSARAGDTLGLTVGAATCFWAGMLVSRALQSHPEAACASERWMIQLGPGLATAGLMIIVAMNGRWILAGALMLGMGVGPMYPLLLAMTLRHGEAGNVIFALAGAGASLLPLLTGVVSGWAGSLKSGLAVPLSASLVMLLLGAAFSHWALGQKTG